MDKKTFMRELERSLSVLQESELRDILSEYEQHIDMKVKSGLSEEEAIADFGSLPELTAEILEAYHVRADYGPGQRAETAGEQRQTAGTMGTDPAKARETEKRTPGGGRNVEGQGSRVWKESSRIFFGAGKTGRKACQADRQMGLRRFCILEGAAWPSLPAIFQTLEAEEGGTAVSDRWKYGDGKCRKEERKRRSIFRKDRRFLWTQAGRYGKTVL